MNMSFEPLLQRKVYTSLPFVRRQKNLELVLISAWNDSGGGFTNRLLDGHSKFFCWPFELQLGTAQSVDGFEGWFHLKYRWPTFPSLAVSADSLFDSIIDDELKGKLTLGYQSKFAAFEVQADLVAWREEFKRTLPKKRNRADVIKHYIISFFSVWQNRVSSGKERFYLGHCPIIAMDADLIYGDFPDAKILHIVRSPFAGFNDMRARRPTVTADSYSAKWSLVNSWAVSWARKKPQQFRIVSLSDLLRCRESTMEIISDWLGVNFESVLLTPSWNNEPIESPGPFGGVPVISAEYEDECMRNLSAADFDTISRETSAVRKLLAIATPNQNRLNT